MMQWPLGYLSDKLGRRKLQSVAALSAAVVAALIVANAADSGPATIVTLGAAWGAFAFPLYAISVAHTNDHADPRDVVCRITVRRRSSYAICGAARRSGPTDLASFQRLPS